VTSSYLAQVTVNSRLPDTVVYSGVNTTGFSAGQIVSSVTANLEFECVGTGSSTVFGPLMNSGILVTGIASTDTLVSPTAKSACTTYALYSGTTATIQW